MRLILTWTACIGFALLGAGCNPNDPNFFTQGVGTTLYPGDVSAQTATQNAYVGEICQQAGLQPAVFDGVTSCGPNPYDAATWWLFVQAGMNDIDQRCDAYLAWLDDIQRSREPVLNELAVVSSTAQTIMRSTGVGANPITIAGAAFGLASSTFTNIYSRQIITMPHSTVQAVVLSRQKDYRDQLIGNSATKPAVAILNRPAALYALRSYLRLCMPMTIETEINNTIATFERNGANGLQKDALISPQTAGVPFTPASIAQKPPRNPPVAPDADVAPFFSETNLSKADTELTLRGLCLDKNSGTGLLKADVIKALVAVYKTTLDPKNPLTFNSPMSSLTINRNDRDVINKQSKCNAARNYFEKSVFANTLSPQQSATSTEAFAAFIAALNRAPDGGNLVGTTALGSSDLRSKIQAVRAAIGPNDVPAALNDQATPAFFSVLKKNFPPPKTN